MKRLLLAILRPNTRVLKYLFGFIIVGLLATGYFFDITPIIAFLDAEPLVIHMGSSSFSLYFIFKVLFTLVIVIWVAGIISGFLENKIQNLSNTRERNKALLIKALQIFVYFIAFVIGLDLIGVDLTSLSILGGAIGIGIGFGLQKITSNFISGLILLIENTIENDDLIELPDGLSGFVRQTNARYTLIETFDGRDVMVPNEDFMTNRVINWTLVNAKGRVEIPVGVAYGSDLDEVVAVMLEAAQSHPSCIDDPEPACYVENFGDSAITCVLYFWVADVALGRKGPKSDVMRSIVREFEKRKIQIPFPQRDIHIIKEGEIS